MLLAPCYFFPFFVNHWSFFFFTAKHLYIFFRTKNKSSKNISCSLKSFTLFSFQTLAFNTLLLFAIHSTFFFTAKHLHIYLITRNIYLFLKFFTPFLFHTHISISYSSKVTTFHSPLFKIKILTYFIKLIFLFSYWIILLHTVIKKSTIFFFQITHHTLQETQLIFIYRIVQKHFHPLLSLSLYSLQFEHLTRSIFF